jgi:3',5'-cyclic AMP phosphodiesterase CpdA
MNGCIVHLSDLHFGGDVVLPQIEAAEELIPDLEPQATVISGDLTQRARHGEFQATRALVRELERTAPVLVVPGNHDVQWWFRPLLPFGHSAKYHKFTTYFGPTLTPTLTIPGATIVSALTSHGVAWGSLTLQPRDLAIKGHLPAAEISRVSEQFRQADPQQLRVLVLHHNILQGDVSRRMGLARWKQAQRAVAASGAELVLCGHDHQEKAEQLGGKVIISCVGTFCNRSRGNRPTVFHRICWDLQSIQIEQYRWDRDRSVFKRSDVYAFTRLPRVDEASVTARTS